MKLLGIFYNVEVWFELAALLSTFLKLGVQITKKATSHNILKILRILKIIVYSSLKLNFAMVL